MEDLLTNIVNRMNHELPGWAPQYIRSCIFLPQLGFLVVVELEPATGKGKFDGDGEWEKTFVADDMVCYKNSWMRELDDEFGDMYCEIGGSCKSMFRSH